MTCRDSISAVLQRVRRRGMPLLQYPDNVTVKESCIRQLSITYFHRMVLLLLLSSSSAGVNEMLLLVCMHHYWLLYTDI